MPVLETKTDIIVMSVVLFIYILILIFIGLYFYRKNKNQADYILGGRKVNVWLVSLSAQASDMSGWLLLGLPGLAYLSIIGATEAVWTAIGLALGTYLNWKIVAKRLRQYTFKANNSITLPDYFSNRFKDNSNIIRTISALFIFIFFLVYTASGFSAGAKLFNTIFGLDYRLSLCIGVFVIVGYTFLGGFHAVCSSDFIQGILMFFAILIVPTVAIIEMPTILPELTSFATSLPSRTISNIGIMGIISALAWGLGYFGQPHILVRFMSIDKASHIKPARMIAMIWVILSLIGSVVVGIVARSYLPTHGGLLMDGRSETVFMVMALKIFPIVVSAILIAAILAAIISTADSQLLVTASAVSQDFYRVFFKRNSNEKELVIVSRITVVAVAIIAAIIASNPNSSVFRLVQNAWAGFGATFGPIVIMSLFWKRMTKYAAIAGIITGGTTVIVWILLRKFLTTHTNYTLAIFNLYEIVPGFLFSLIAIIVVSLMDKKPSDDIINEFNGVNEIE